MVNENTRRNLEQEVAGFRAQAAAGERAMKVHGMLPHPALTVTTLQKFVLAMVHMCAVQAG